MVKNYRNRIYLILLKYQDKFGLDFPYFVKNGFWLVARQFISIICGLAFSIVLARILDKEIFGQLQYIMSIWLLLSVFSIPGLNIALMASTAHGYDGDYKKVVKISFISGLIAIPILIFLGGYYIRTQHSLGLALIITSFLFPFGYACNTWESYLQGKSKFNTATRYFFVTILFNTLAIIAAALFYANNLIIITGVYLFTLSFFNVYYFFRSLRFIKNDRQDQQVVKYGWFLTKMNTLEIVADNLDKILLAALISPASLAVYVVISTLPIRIKESIKPFFSLFFPKFATTQSNLKVLIRGTIKFAAFFVYLIIFSSLIYYVLIDKVNYLFFGEKYKDYYFYSKYFILTILLFIPQNLMVRFAQAKKNSRVIFISDFSYAIIRIALSVILILWKGVLGAVIAYNLSFFVWFMLYFINLIYEKGINQSLNHKNL